MDHAVTPIPVTTRGASWRLDAPDDHVGRIIRRSGRPYEEDLLDALATLIRPGDLVVDVGANIGNHSIYFAVACRARVEAFEPNGEARKYLVSNVIINDLEQSVMLHPEALSDHAGYGSISNPRESVFGTGSSSVVDDPKGKVETVRLADQLLSTVRLLKIDVEGAEEAVIRGGIDLLRRDRPVVVAESGDASDREQVEALLRPLGYRRFPMPFAFTPTWIYITKPLDFVRLATCRTVRRRIRAHIRF